MAIVNKDKLYDLWKRFQASPTSLNVNEYKTIADSAQTLYRQGEISANEAQNMMSAVSKYY